MTISGQEPIKNNNSKYVLDNSVEQPTLEKKVSEFSNLIVTQESAGRSIDGVNAANCSNNENVKQIDPVAVGHVKEGSCKQVDEELKNKINTINGYWDEYLKQNSSRSPISFETLLASNNTTTSYMTFITGIYGMALEARNLLYKNLMRAMIGKQKDYFQSLYLKVFIRLPLIAHLIVEYRAIVSPNTGVIKLFRSSDSPSEKKTILNALSEQISVVKKSLCTIRKSLIRTYKNDPKRLSGAMDASSKIIDILNFIDLLKEQQEIEFLFCDSKKIIESSPLGSIQHPKTSTGYFKLSESMLDQLSNQLQEFVFFWKRDPTSKSKLNPINKAIDLIQTMKSEFETCHQFKDFEKIIDLERKLEEFFGHPIHEVATQLIFTVPRSFKSELKNIQLKYNINELFDLTNRLFYHETLKDFDVRARYEFKFGMKTFLAEKSSKIDSLKFGSLMQMSHEYAKDSFHVLAFIDKIGMFSADKNYYNFIHNPCKALHDLSKEVTLKLSFIQKNPEMFQLTADCFFPLIDILSTLSFHILSSGSTLVNNILQLRKKARRIRVEGMDPKNLLSIKTKHQIITNLKAAYSKEEHVDCEFLDSSKNFVTNMKEKELFDMYVEQHEELLKTKSFDGVKQTAFEKMFWKFVNDNQLWSSDDTQYLLDMVVDMQLGALEIIDEIKNICKSPVQTKTIIKETPINNSDEFVFESSSQFTILNLSEVLGIDNFFILEPVVEKRTLVQSSPLKPEKIEVEIPQKELIEEIDEVPEILWEPERWYKLRKVLKQLRKMGFEQLPSKRGRGSHIMMKNSDGNVVTLPKKLKKGTVLNIMK